MRVIGEGSVGEIVVCIGYLLKEFMQKSIALSFLGSIALSFLGSIAFAVVVVIKLPLDDLHYLSSFAVAKDNLWVLTCPGTECFLSILFKGSGFFAVFGRLSEFW